MNNIYNELKKYYTMYDNYYNVDVELPEEEEDRLAGELTDQEVFVINLLFDYLNKAVDKKTIYNMLLTNKDKLLSLFSKLEG